LRLAALSALLLFGTMSVASAVTYVVDPYGTGDFPTIQDAIDATADTDVVELVAGTYRGPGNRDVTTLGRRITIRSNLGDAEMCTIDCERASRGIDLGEGAHLENVTIRNARGNGVTLSGKGSSLSGVHVHGCGRGLFVNAEPARVTDCVISGNGPRHWGGGVRLNVGATFENCIISGNIADIGGGVFFRGKRLFDPPLVLRQCTVTGNLAHAGGGVHCGMPQRRFVAPVELDRTILFGNFGGDLNLHQSSDSASIACSVPDLARVSGAIDAIEYGSGNVYGDPRFCDPIVWEDVPTTGGDFTLYVTSPAANSPLCGLIGALGVGCGGTPVEIGPTAPTSFALRPLSPNPFREATAIRWEVPRRVPVEIGVYEVSGRKIRTLVKGARGPGAGVERWSGHDDTGKHVSAGVYFVRMTAPGFEMTQRVVRLP